MEKPTSTPSDRKAAYVYSSTLPASSIRLVTLLPGAGASKIACLLTEYEQREGLDYHALSYVWGDASITKEITLEGVLFEITENLYSALSHMRHPTEAKVLWIDAISINQQNIIERNIHVRVMTKLYSNATMVICWLGPDANDSNFAMGKLLEIMKAVRLAQASSAGEPNARLLSIVHEHLPKILENNEDFQRLWTALEHLYRRDWFKRAWILQEATADVQTVLMCGTTWMSRDTAFMATMVLFKFFDHENNAEELIRSDVTQGARLNLFRDRRLAGGEEMRLCNLLPEFRRRDATDPRDYVYAALPIARDGEGIVPDYSKPLKKVYQDLVIHLATHHGDDWRWPRQLDVLGICVKNSDSSFPSWTPDLRLNQRETPFTKMIKNPDDATTWISAYAACGRFKEDVYPVMCDTIPMAFLDDLMYIQGAVIDIITDLTIVSTSRTSCDIEKSWRPAGDTTMKYFTGDTLDAAIARTVVADMLHSKGQYLTRGHSMQWPTKATVLMENQDDDIGSLKAACYGRRMGLTQTGFIGIFPADTAIGDQVCVLAGGQMLHMIRPPKATSASVTASKKEWDVSEQGDDGILQHLMRMQLHDKLSKEESYQYVGECYVHGLMDGEIIDMFKENGAHFRRIAIK